LQFAKQHLLSSAFMTHAALQQKQQSSPMHDAPSLWGLWHSCCWTGWNGLATTLRASAEKIHRNRRISRYR
jgi:hypothetical protein